MHFLPDLQEVQLAPVHQQMQSMQSLGRAQQQATLVGLSAALQSVSTARLGPPGQPVFLATTGSNMAA